jgi:hypothetical protein
MSDIAIRVEHLGKQYRIGGPRVRYQTLRDTLMAGLRAPWQRLSSFILHPSPNGSPPDE